jgi:hypothetical protein
MAAAPTVLPAPAPIADLPLDDAHSRLMGLLREARAEFQHLQATLETLRGVAEDRTTTAGALDGAVDVAAKAFDLDNARVTEIFGSLRALLDGVPRLYAWSGDEVAHVFNGFGDAAEAWPRLHAPADEVVAACARASKPLGDAIFHVVRLTAAARVNDHLATLPIGGAADVDRILGDELADDERRNAILGELAASPIGLGGVVDAAARKIYRVAPSRKTRIATLLLPPAALAIGVLLFAGLAYLDNRAWVPAEWPQGLTSGESLLVAYLFVTLGALVHVAVGYLKRAREQGPEPLVVASIFWWLHVRFGTITLNVLWLWIAVVGLGVSNKLSAVTAFFAGYSIDSVADLFLKKLEGGATSHGAALKKIVARVGA